MTSRDSDPFGAIEEGPDRGPEGPGLLWLFVGSNSLMLTMSLERKDLEREIDEIIESNRATCLWFWREHYFPKDDAERMRALDAIQRHGDLAAFRRAGQLKAWLSPNSNETSVVS